MTLLFPDASVSGHPDLDPLLASWRRWMRAQSWSHRTIDDRVDLIQRVSRQIGRPPENLDVDDVLEFLSGSFLASTRQTYHVNLDSWFRWLQRHGGRPDNPMSDLAIPKAKRRPPRPVSTSHLVHLLDTRMKRKTRTMILLAAYQGLRVSEIAKFRGDKDIDLRSKELRVIGKGNVDAILPLHPIIEAEAALYGPGWWFPQWKPNRDGDDGGHILGRSVSTVVANAMHRAEIPGSAHALRHWYATELLRAGVDSRVVMDLMRHASLATTQRYLHVDDTQRRAGLLLLPDATRDVVVEMPAAIDPVTGMKKWHGLDGLAA